MKEEKDVNSEAYKRGWNDGYQEGQSNQTEVSPADIIQYQYGFDDGLKAYTEEISNS